MYKQGWGWAGHCWARVWSLVGEQGWGEPGERLGGSAVCTSCSPCAQPRHREEVGGSSYGLEVAWKSLFPELSGKAGRPNSRSPLFASPEPEHLGNGYIRQSGV